MAANAPMAMITPTPLTLIKLRDPINIFNTIEGGAKSVESGAKHLGSEVTSKVEGVPAALQSEVVKAVNEAYEGIIDKLNLNDFYSIHLRTSCSRTYVTSDGKNITVGGNVAPDNGTYEHVDSCEKHSDFVPVELAQVAYIFGIACIGVAIACAIWGLSILQATTNVSQDLTSSRHQWLSQLSA